MMMYKSLFSTGQKSLAAGPLVDSIRRVGCFGICLAPLDLRQVRKGLRGRMDGRVGVSLGG